MLFFFTLILTISVSLILPGWLHFRQPHPQSYWLLFLPCFGIGSWVALIEAGIGPQSLVNILEIFVVAFASVLMPYVKFLAMDRSSSLKSHGLLVSYIVVATLVLGLRLFMPVLPE